MKQLALLVVMGSATLASAQPYDPTQYLTCPKNPARAPTTPFTGTPKTTDPQPYDVVVSADGQWVYVSRLEGLQVFSFANGVLSETAQSFLPNTPAHAQLTIANRQFSGLALTTRTSDHKPLLIAAAHDQSGQASHVVVFDVSNPQSITSTKIATPGAHPGSIEVRTNGHYAWIANEYNDTISTLDLTATPIPTFSATQVGTWHHPVGMAYDAQQERLFVATERVFDGQDAAGMDPALGTIEMFDVSGGTPVYHDMRNGGCGPARLHLDGQGRLFDSARDSNAVYVFDADVLWGTKSGPEIVGYAVTGPKPLDTAFASNGDLLLVANSNRTDADGDGLADAPGSMVAFRHSDIASQSNPAPVRWYAPGGGLFSRQIAVHGSDVFMTNFDSASLMHYSVP